MKYICDICGQRYNDAEEVWACEDSHPFITDEIYEDEDDDNFSSLVQYLDE